jgi:serine/threonine protein kinase
MHGIVSALAHLHALGAAHRDVKGANLLVSADGSAVKLADFGSAKLPPRVAAELEADLAEEDAAARGEEEDEEGEIERGRRHEGDEDDGEEGRGGAARLGGGGGGAWRRDDEGGTGVLRLLGLESRTASRRSQRAGTPAAEGDEMGFAVRRRPIASAG